jgi:deazaflavin-dependent oxidoreductase (nitroreductase family)
MSDETTSSYSQPDLSLVGAEHVRRYEETDGEVGYLWNGVTCLILHTTGARTGQPRKSPLICGFDGDRCVIVASMGGAPRHPAWYHNLVADPNVTVQLKGERFAAVARTAEGDERARLWKTMTGVWPNYDEYATRTTRVIPVVVLERRT